MLGRIISMNNLGLSHKKLGYDSNLLAETQSTRNYIFCPNSLFFDLSQLHLCNSDYEGTSRGFHARINAFYRGMIFVTFGNGVSLNLYYLLYLFSH